MRITDFEYLTTYDGFPDRKVLLVGMLEDGPVGRAFSMNSPEKVTLYLGENEVTDTYQYLTETGVPAEDIYFYRLNGRISQIEVLGLDEKPLIELRALTGHEYDNNIQLVVSEQGVSLISNYGEEELTLTKRRNFSRSYLFEEFPTIQELADAIMQDANLGLTNIIANPLAHEMSKDAFAPGDIFDLNHGASEESLCIRNSDYPEGYLNDYWNYFNQRILAGNEEDIRNSILMDYPVEVYYFADFPFDGSEEAKSIAQIAALIAKEKTDEQTVLTTALFPTRPIPLRRELEIGEFVLEDGTFFNEIEQEYQVYMPDHETNTFVLKLVNAFTEEERHQDYMKHLQIVVGEEDQGGIISPAAQFYLGLYLTNSIQQPLSNKTLVNFNQLRKELPKTLIASLVAKGYTCSVPSIRKGVVLSRAQNMKAIENKILDNLYHLRIVQYISRDIGLLVDRYIGQPKSVYRKSFIQDEIEDYLDFYTSNSGLVSYEVSLEEGTGFYDSEKIELNLVFYGELKEINTTIQMREEGWAFDLWTMNE